MTICRRSFLANSLFSFGATILHAETFSPPRPFGVYPSQRQLAWQRMETYSFLHFTVNTFTGKEWGYGDEDPTVFNPTAFDADAIVAALKDGGMKGVILTCKHHDGFCLWPTKTTEHSIRHSTWQDGKGDVVRDISNAARRHGLKFGVYVSPWDRNNPNYGKPAYLPIYRQQITELLTNYGPLFEVWFDGANGGDGFYGGAKEKRSIDARTYYEWPRTIELVRRLQPGAVIFGAGPEADVRWVGNEKGYANETCWATYTPPPLLPPNADSKNELMSGTFHGTNWMPAECDVSIRPGWFWHEQENSQVKSPQQLMDLYLKSVGRGASLLLNVPPNRQGILQSNDVEALKGLHQLIQAAFQDNLAAKATLRASNVRGNSQRYGTRNLVNNDPNSYWATDDTAFTPELTVDFRSTVKFNLLRIREATQLGQRIEAFALDIWQGDQWKQVLEATSIGSCRLVRLSHPAETRRVRLRITKSPVCIALSEFGLYLDSLSSVEKLA